MLEEHGSGVKPHTVPFHVALVENRKKGVPFCSGTLISPNYVLTTAHCVAGKSINSFLVVVGEHDYNVKGDGEQFVHVQAIFQHPDFFSHKQADFTLLKLSEAVVFSKFQYTGIACLPQNQTLNFVGEDLIMSGWEMAKDSSQEHQSSHLRASILNGISTPVCQDIHPHKEVSEHKICAYGSIKHLCRGNAGGKICQHLQINF